MAGVKGRSGRKTRVSENSRAEVIMKSWDVLKRFFEAEDISLEKKAEIATRIASKDMPTEFKGDALVKNYVQIFRPETYTAEELETASRPADRGV